MSSPNGTVPIETEGILLFVLEGYSLDQKVDNAEFESKSLAAWPRTSYLTSLRLNYLIDKVRSHGALNEVRNVEYPA